MHVNRTQPFDFFWDKGIKARDNFWSNDIYEQSFDLARPDRKCYVRLPWDNFPAAATLLIAAN